MVWMSMKRTIWVLCMGCLAAAGCRGADKNEPAIDGRVLARAADHFKTDPGDIGARLLCKSPRGDGCVFETYRKDVTNGARAFIILKGGKASGPGDEGHGPELAFAACRVRDQLPGDALTAARVFFALSGPDRGRRESVVDDTERLEPAEDGTLTHAPAVSIIEGGWNLTFWTHDPDACTYRRTKVFILRSGSIELSAKVAHPYACP